MALRAGFLGIFRFFQGIMILFAAWIPLLLAGFSHGLRFSVSVTAVALLPSCDCDCTMRERLEKRLAMTFLIFFAGGTG